MKKFYLLTKTLLVTALLMVGANAWGDETRTSVYSNDFESTSDWVAKGKTDGWTTNPGNTDRNTFDSNVIGVGAGSGDMGLVSPSGLTTSPTWVDVEMKFKIDACADTKSSGIEFITSDVNINNGYVRSGTPFFAIKASAGGNGYFSTITVGGIDYTTTLKKSSGSYDGHDYNKATTYLDRNTTGIVVLNVRFNFNLKIATFTLKDTSGSTLVDATTVDFANSNATALDRIFIHAGRTYGGVTIDDVNVYTVSDDSKYAYAVKNSFGEYLSVGTSAAGSTFGANTLDYVKMSDSKYYVLNDANVSHCTASYTMGTADVKKIINYTLDEAIAFFIEGENCGGTNEDNANYSGGKHCTMMSKKTKEISITNAGKYCVEAYITGRAGNGEFKVYDSDGTTELANLARNSVTGSRSTGSFWRNANTSIKVGYKDGNSMSFDYIIVRKTDTDVTDAIADCKTYETSDAFATYIDGLYAVGSLTTTAEVYAAHTAWQIAQAKASGSVNLTKLIRNAAVADGTDWDGATILNGEKYTGAPDEYYLDKNTGEIDASQTIYGLPAGVYVLKAATRAKAGTSGNIYVWDGANNHTTAINANGNTGGGLDNGWDWTEVEFTLTSTANVKIGFWADVDGYWASCDDFHMYKVESVSKTISDAGWSTFASSYALDLSSMAASTGTVKAYYASEATGSTVTLAETTATVPAGEGIMLKGTAGATITIPVAASGTSISGNLLKGQTTTGNVAASGTDDKYHYVFGFNTADPSIYGFYNLASTTSVPAGKAYLETTAALSAARVAIIFDDEESTGIADVKDNMGDVNGNFYDLSGRKVAQPTKGLYIVNGKKVIIK